MSHPEEPENNAIEEAIANLVTAVYPYPDVIEADSPDNRDFRVRVMKVRMAQTKLQRAIRSQIDEIFLGSSGTTPAPFNPATTVSVDKVYGLIRHLGADEWSVSDESGLVVVARGQTGAERVVAIATNESDSRLIASAPRLLRSMVTEIEHWRKS